MAPTAPKTTSHVVSSDRHGPPGPGSGLCTRDVTGNTGPSLELSERGAVFAPDALSVLRDMNMGAVKPVEREDILPFRACCMELNVFLPLSCASPGRS